MALEACDKLDFPVAVEGPSTKLTFLGISVELQLSLPEGSLQN